MSFHALISAPWYGTLQAMKQPSLPTLAVSSLLYGMLLLIPQPLAAAPPTPAATSAFSVYISQVEARLSQQHQSPATFLALPDPDSDLRLRRGEFIVEQLTPPNAAPAGALLHHWRGTAFVPGATASNLERLLKDFNAYPRIYAPQVLQAKVLTQQGDHLTASLRVRQKHVLTVVMDTTYDVTFSHLDPQHGSSLSRSTHIAELNSADVPLSPADDHGFLWRLNTYWTYVERDGGLYIQIESVTLTRAIPHGLAWAVQPFTQSIPRESLEFTLRATTNALHK